MKNISNSFVSLSHWPFAGGFGFNTDILATNPINLSVVFGVLIFFGKRVCARKQRILNTIRNSDKRREEAIEPLEKAKYYLRKVEMEADQFRVNGYSEIEREKLNLINSTYATLKQFENYKNETISFEQQRVIHQVQQHVFQQALQGAVRILNNSLNNELHLRTLSANIDMLGVM
uniref:ATP synthase CF0 B subunit n=1 Tax=Taxillus chinensis TaxID=227909 RepID=A0A2D1GRU5_9MAGN|nr:ATP synthase CF0 B subunit [Taxillus chinensis]ATN95690.1 ATP synthase CF0 B subunit [Taxillus chinensis]QQY86222.1 ATP synthase CF0 B subunit [Taxillus chinensis]WGC44203.1 ATP synthase CF0 B subunit [Taxillus chinensis]